MLNLIMREHEDYFNISQKEHIHVLSDRIPLRWEELFIWTSASFFILIAFVGPFIGLLIGILTLLGYILYRFASYIVYFELLINTKSGEMIRLQKVFNHTQRKELITTNFDASKFEYIALNRSGEQKFVLRYKTHMNHDLLIIRNEEDKNLIEQYIQEI